MVLIYLPLRCGLPLHGPTDVLRENLVCAKDENFDRQNETRLNIYLIYLGMYLFEYFFQNITTCLNIYRKVEVWQ